MSNGKILIVEDDKHQLLSTAALLRSAGYEVVGTSEGMSAIREAAQHSPDVILLDLGLPAGDGFWVLERLKSRFQLSQIPVIVLTARDGEETRRQVVDAGADGFGLKPIDPDLLLDSIRRLMAGSGAVAGATG